MIYFCAQRNRRTLVLARPALNGIDYLEVPDEAEQTVLVLTLLRDAAAVALGPEQVAILGGESVTGIKTMAVAPMPDAPNALRIEVDRAGDFSTYTLMLRADENTDEPPLGIDPALARIDFSFKAGCPVTTDCAPVSCCPVAVPIEPDINYLAKDYPGFVQVMLDRLAVTAPSWTERHAADLGVALVEVLAYVADHLSYRQDAVATEAYLGTARSRISLRRHARLVDYRVDEGENARVWVFLRADAEGVYVPAGTLLLPRVAGVAPRLDPNGAVAGSLLAAGGVVFATLADATLSHALNKIKFHTWSDEACCLPAGATAATLKGHLDTLAVGAVLMFEEVLGPDTGAKEDADRTHRCAVRLTRVHHTDRFGQVLTDPVTGESITDIEWQAADALTFALCLSAVTDAEHGARLIDNISVARGNIVPADHGLWSGADEDLGTVPEPPTPPINTASDACCTAAADVPPRLPQFFPSLSSAPLTFARQYDSTAPASALGSAPPADADPPTPQIKVRDDHDNLWKPETDLLALPASTLGFLVEVERDGTAFLRFGDGEHGAAPATGQSFRARYRIGNGSAGNLGADTIGHVLTTDSRISAVRNPLPARGGRDPETMEAIRQSAPWAFRSQLRAVTESDYGIAAELDPEVHAARGTLRWTGSWRTAFVALDPAPAAPPVADLALATLNRLDLLRMAGVDLAAEPAVIVGLRIALSVCIEPHYLRSEVGNALSRMFTAGIDCNGRPGLLDPSNFSFGQTIYLSPFVAAAQQVAGVASVRATAFQRVDDPDHDATSAGFMTLQRLEIARIDNDPSRLDRGIFKLALDGGQ